MEAALSEDCAKADEGTKDLSFDISALVVNYNSTFLARQMLESLAKQSPCNASGETLSIEFVFVDNASPMLDQEELEKIRDFAGTTLPGKVVMHDENSGYAGGMNLALEHARGEHILVLNPDLVFFDGCVEALHRQLVSDSSIGAVGPSGFWEEGREVRLPPNILPTLTDLVFCTAAHVFTTANRAYMNRRVRDALQVWAADEAVGLSMLSGACLMLRRETIEEIGGLFDSAFPLYYEDTDLFRRIEKAGKRLVLEPRAEIAHFYNRSGTTAQEEAMRRYWLARSYYYRKYYGVLGTLTENTCRFFLKSRLAGRARRKMEGRVIDLGDVTRPPTLNFPRSSKRVLLEMCQDAAFLLAAGIFTEGSEWTPSERFWNAFGESEYFFRVLDLASGKPEELCVYRFRRVPESAEPESS